MLLRALAQLFSEDLAVDLGTANTVVYVRGKGIVLNEPRSSPSATGIIRSWRSARRPKPCWAGPPARSTSSAPCGMG